MKCLQKKKKKDVLMLNAEKLMSDMKALKEDQVKTVDLVINSTITVLSENNMVLLHPP